ncbi:MAG: DUF3883 domain-containing protein [Limisphaerales bacterium]
MLPDFQRISSREKLILAGLYLSKYDSLGLKKLGFESFQEAFNVIGYGLGFETGFNKKLIGMNLIRYSQINDKAGTNGQDANTVLRFTKNIKDLDLETFSALLKSFVDYDENALSVIESREEKKDGESFFAKRLITGLAAEHYFEEIQPKLPEFKNYILENTTRLGCGYDFRLARKSDDKFLAVEVKGLQDRTGSLALTPKEYEMASSLSERFYLFVVKNFRELPVHDIYCNPLSSSLKFTRKERVVVQISWSATI